MDTGQRISQRGGEISGYGDAWSAAQKQLVSGRAKVANAEERIREAQTEKAEGEQMISDGTAKMQRAESGYKAISGGPSAVGSQAQN
jgi:hypothetical protein